MKTSQLVFRLALALVGSILFSLNSAAQTRGSADPVGFITLSITGTSGASSSSVSYLGLGVTRAVEYQGTAATVGSNTITDNSANWATNQFAGSNGAYFVEVTSINGSTTTTGVRTSYAVTSNNSSTLTLATNLASGIAAPITYKVRKQWTIASLFGASNSAKLQAGSESTADLVQLWNGNSLDSYYYLDSTGWRKVGDSATDAGRTVIPFYRSVLVKRQQASALSYPLAGMVKTGMTAITINTGDNYLGNVYPASFSLANSGLYTGSASTGIAPGTETTADLVMIPNGSALDSYYYQSGVGWRKVGDSSTDASGAVIGQGTGFILRRVNSNSFTWQVPETLVSNTSSSGGTPSNLLNISTRGSIGTGDNILIGGFIITGTTSKQVVIRGIGPSLSNSGVGGALANPTLTLFDSSGNSIASNDDWQSDAGASTISGDGLAPSSSAEAATLQTLAPGNYTVQVSGKDSTTGIGLVEVYDVSGSTGSVLANISTRGNVGTNDNVLIGGFILGSGNTRVVVRGLGPSLTGVSNKLADPKLTIVNSSGTTVATNDNWSDDANASAIQSATLAPTNSAEAATLQTLAGGAYTVIVQGASNSTGVALVEIYNID